MKHSTLYRGILALLGMVLLIFALLFFVFAFMLMTDSPKNVGRDGHEIWFGLFGLLLVAIALYLFSGAPHISRFARAKNAE